MAHRRWWPPSVCGRKHKMVIKIIALIIGVLILGTGLYYLSKEKHDPESRKIYGIVSAVAAALLLVL